MSEPQTEHDNPLVDVPDNPEEAQPEAPETPQEPTPDEPDAEPVETPEPDEQPPQEPAQPTQTPEARDKMLTASEKRWQRFKSGTEDLFEGSGMRILECPLCPDIHKGFVDLDFAGRIPEEVAANVKMYLGLAREVQYKPSRRFHTCPECEGEGKVDTGSHVPTQRTITCEDCKGRGFVPPPGVEPVNGLTGPTTYTADQLEQYAQSREDVDEWNEPRILPDGRENPNFGRMPNRKVLVEPWGITAGLTSLDAVT